MADVTHFVQQAAPIATKAAIGAGGTTAAAASYWTLPEIAAAVGIVCTVSTFLAAVTFQFLNYRLNKARVREDR